MKKQFATGFQSQLVRLPEIIVWIISLLVFISMMFGFNLNAQENTTSNKSVTSLYFARDSVVIRLRGNLMWNEHLKDEKCAMSIYGNITLSAVVVAERFAGFIKAYDEGGFVAIFPFPEFSSESFVFGGYGLFRFEFYPGKRSCYFIEGGGIGTGATTDNSLTEPIYSNGFLKSVGMLFHVN